MDVSVIHTDYPYDIAHEESIVGNKQCSIVLMDGLLKIVSYFGHFSMSVMYRMFAWREVEHELRW